MKAYNFCIILLNYVCQLEAVCLCINKQKLYYNNNNNFIKWNEFITAWGTWFDPGPSEDLRKQNFGKNTDNNNNHNNDKMAKFAVKKNEMKKMKLLLKEVPFLWATL